MPATMLQQSSRRGLKELDLLLHNFLNHLPNDFNHKAYLELMQLDDQTLLANIMKPQSQLIKEQKKICQQIAQAISAL